MTTHLGQTVRINVWQKLRNDHDGKAEWLVTEVMRLDQPYQTAKGTAATHVLQATFEFVYTGEHDLRYEMAKLGFDHHEALLAEAKEALSVPDRPNPPNHLG